MKAPTKGKGLGIKFLRHIERTKILLFLIDITSENYQEEYNVLLNELKSHSKKLAEKTKIVSLSKADLIEESEIKKISKKKIKNADSPPLVFSAVSGYGLTELLDYLWKALEIKNVDS